MQLKRIWLSPVFFFQFAKTQRKNGQNNLIKNDWSLCNIFTKVFDYKQGQKRQSKCSCSCCMSLLNVTVIDHRDHNLRSISICFKFALTHFLNLDILYLYQRFRRIEWIWSVAGKSTSFTISLHFFNSFNEFKLWLIKKNSIHNIFLFL